MFRMSQKVGHDLPVVTGFILHALWCGAIAEIKIPRKARGASKMRLRVPQAVILGSQSVGLGQPGAILVASRLLRRIDPQNHRGQEWRLGAREIVGPVSVQYGAVVLDLEQKVVHHVPRKVEPAIAEKPHDDEIAVPSIHFVKSATRHNVTIFEIEQSGRRNCSRAGFSQAIAGGKKIPHLDFTARLKLLYGFRFREIRGKVELGGACQFRVAKSGAVG